VENGETECLKDAFITSESQTDALMQSTESHTDALTQSTIPARLPADSSQDADFVLRFSELADRYWNGSKSLLRNQRFKSQHHANFRT